jgi:putative methionine-R-sulfoxide reductase with GAF domain
MNCTRIGLSLTVTDERNKPGLDEQTFAKLLEAAYVLQEHNREIREMEESLELHSEQLRQQEAETQAALLRSARRTEEPSRPNPEYTLTLAEIVEAQHQIQIRHLESDNAMAVVAERITRITNASGAAIGILEGKTIRYRAGAGAPAPPVGSEVPLETAICAICVRTGQVLRTPDVNTEFLFDPDLCRAREIESLVAVPVYHDGNIVGALELYFDRLNGFAEQDIHTCQLMAGLVTEAIGRDAGSALKKSMAAERSSMLAAIEELKPSRTASADGVAEYQHSGIADNSVGSPAVSAAEGAACWKCGSKVIGEEQFCGECGAPRAGEGDSSSMQSKLASA